MTVEESWLCNSVTVLISETEQRKKIIGIEENNPWQHIKSPQALTDRVVHWKAPLKWMGIAHEHCGEVAGEFL